MKLEPADVDVPERLLQVRQSKFFKSRRVPIGPKLAKVLEDYRSSETPWLLVFQWAWPAGSPV